jgi:hypothetical protein
VRHLSVVALFLLLAALLAGTWADRPREAGPHTIGGYQVLATDFHVHSFPFSWSTLSVFDTVIDARHQRLDAVVLTPHNHQWVARAGEWFSRMIGGPVVIVGEEITAPGYHLLAAGTHEVVPPTLTAADAIAAIHRQGGVAIAAHPYSQFWAAWDEAAMRTLDGSELVRPESSRDEESASQLRTFFDRGHGHFAAIGATDYHGLGPVGYTRTYVFARERSATAIINAVRARQTVVSDDQHLYGDPALVALVSAHGRLPAAPPFPPRTAIATFSRLLTVIALAVLLLFNRAE